MTSASGSPSGRVDGSLSATASALRGWDGVTFEEITAGDVIATREFTITVEELRRFRACLGETVSGEGPHHVPAFLLNEFRTIKGSMRLPPGVLHASEEVEHLRPVRVGERLTASVRISGTFTRNGKPFVVMEQEVRPAGAEQPALRITRTLFWPC